MTKPTMTEFTRRWTLANIRLKSCRAALNGAECEAMNAANALGKHIAPSDMTQGEEIGVWVRFEADEEAIVQVVKKSDADFELSIRGRRPVPE